MLLCENTGMNKLVLCFYHTVLILRVQKKYQIMINTWFVSGRINGEKSTSRSVYSTHELYCDFITFWSN